MKQVFWEAVGYDEQGNAIIKVFNQEQQQRMAQLVEEAEKRVKRTEKPMVELTAMGDFDALIDALLTTEAVYMVPGKMTGQNLRIDHSKIEKKQTSSTGEKKERAPKEKQVLVLSGIEGEW